MEVLIVMREFLGQGGVDWYLKVVDNLTLDGKLEEARTKLKTMRKFFPENFETYLAEGLLLSKEGEWEKSLNSFRIAAEKKQEAFRPYFESADIWIALGNPEKAKRSLVEAQARVATLGELKQVRERLQQLGSF